MELVTKRKVYLTLNAAAKLMLVWVFVRLHNATNSEDVWLTRRLQTLNVVVLWFATWTYHRLKETEA